MSKIFNVTGNCDPERHYMVDLNTRLEALKKLVDSGQYITINKARQYGKTTTLIALESSLSDDYYVINMDFQTEMSGAVFEDEYTFSTAFAEAFIYLFDRLKTSGELNEEFQSLKNALNDKFNLVHLFRHIVNICEKSEKPVVLIIDEVDSASNNQVFLDFLAQLRGAYIRRNKFAAFHSVVLAGVHDIRNIQLKIRPDAEHKFNSPWNIACTFDHDMSFSVSDIAGMLEEYENDHHTGMNIPDVADSIYDYTSGYPVLVSQICKFIDEDDKEKCRWDEYGIKASVKKILVSQMPLFESLANKLDEYPDLKMQITDMLVTGKKIPYRPDDESMKQAVMFGFARMQNGELVIANRIFETRFYDMLLTSPDIKKSPLYMISERNKPEFIAGGRLNMELVLEKFTEYFEDIYGKETERFIEDDGRKLFLMYLRPIINGTGNYYIEAQTRDLTRTDVIIDYLGERFIIEMKIWRGEEYNKRGEKQLAEYLDFYRIDKGYMLSFCFNKNKVTGLHSIEFDNKTIVEAVV